MLACVQTHPATIEPLGIEPHVACPRGVPAFNGCWNMTTCGHLFTQFLPNKIIHKACIRA
eukprot:3267707-Amphidinium_carterae.1